MNTPHMFKIDVILAEGKYERKGFLITDFFEIFQL